MMWKIGARVEIRPRLFVRNPVVETVDVFKTLLRTQRRRLWDDGVPLCVERARIAVVFV